MSIYACQAECGYFGQSSAACYDCCNELCNPPPGGWSPGCPPCCWIVPGFGFQVAIRFLKANFVYALILVIAFAFLYILGLRSQIEGRSPNKEKQK